VETSLRARIRAGDSGAFGELFDAHARDVYNHAYRLVGDWATAEDVVSLTFLEAWRLRAAVLTDGGPLRPWLLGIATNVARNTTRSARRHRAALGRLPAGHAHPDIADGVADRLDGADRVAAVRAALGSLRRAEREVFALCVWAGLDHAAAAEALGVPVGTVRSRLSRARARLAALTDVELASQRAARRGQLPGGRPDATRSTQETRP
jgi:RNA polymerase sigma factor (sigma-70 family)